MQTTDMYAVLRDSLAGNRPVDETARQATVLLAERLERLREQHPMFASVSFSPEMERLAAPRAAAMVS